MSQQIRSLRVFVSYASEDKESVLNLCNKLALENIDVWFDIQKILPGQDWEHEIHEAIRESDAIIICLSRKSIEKEGYVQKEIKIALSLADKKPEQTIFIIPAKLEDCQVPSALGQVQWVNLYESEGYLKLTQALLQRAQQLAIKNFFVEKKEFVRFGGVKFVKVPSGNFLMGSPKNKGWEDETPQHVVNINNEFWIGKFPILVFQYLNYLSETKFSYRYKEIKPQKIDCPVTNVSWYDALDYCQWMNKTFRVEFPFGYSCRLPTEAEWELAARGFDGREWPWGNEFSITCCSTREGGEDSPLQPGKFSPSGDSIFGAADMAGNTWEWTSTLWGSSTQLYRYPYNPRDGRENINASKDIYRVVRGGSFYENKDAARCAFRNPYLPLFRSRLLGFRIVLALSK